MDPELDKVLDENNIALSHFAFRWVYCLLIREFPLSLAMRILDTYLSEDSFNELHIYTCAKNLLKNKILQTIQTKQNCARFPQLRIEEELEDT